MIEYWKKCLPFTIGMMLSISFVLLMIEFIRATDFYDFEYAFDGLPYLGIAVICGFIGIPLTISGIERLSK